VTTDQEIVNRALHVIDWYDGSLAPVFDMAGRRMEISTAQEDMVEWLVEALCYPFDFSTDPPIPETWRQLIEAAWVRKDARDADDAAIIRRHVAEEGRWILSDPSRRAVDSRP
jgi:hypothetical protein